MLKKESGNPAERKRLATQDKGWKWVSKLYPTVCTSDRQVFLMSMDKFMSTHDTIVNGRYSIYDSEMIDDAIIFIDEFDATKTTVMRNIIRSDMGKLDYAGIFKRIYRTLEHNGDIWKEYYRSSEDETGRRKTTADMIEELTASARSIAEEYNLDLDFKLEDAPPDSYLFRDSRIVKTGDNNVYRIESDTEDRINRIVCIKRNGDDPHDGSDEPKTGSVSTMLGRMYILFRFFEGIMFRMAMDHYRIQTEAGKSITRDEAIRTVLDPYDFNESQLEYLVNTIKFRPPVKKTDRDPTPDLSFYSLGFEVFSFVDDATHNLATKIYCKSIKRTPEKMLLIALDSSHRARIVGISATARLPSVTGNYDFRYLRNQESYREFVISDYDREHLRSMFKKTVDRYDRVNIEASLISGDSSIFDLLADPEKADCFNEFLESFKGEESFKRRRYLRVFEVYRKFIRTDDLQSMLCFMNLFPRLKNADGERDFSQAKLEDVFSEMVKDYCEELREQGRMIPDYVSRLQEKPFIIVKSGDYSDVKKALMERLARGEKVFVFTTYATVGAGQNLQYPIPSMMSDRIRYISSLADPDKMDRMDFSGIYLDMPTNVISNVYPYNDESLLAALFSIESMQENNEMTFPEAKREVDSAFKKYFDVPGARSEKKGLEHPSYRMAYARTIIQALGRICRTFAKNANIYIMADDALGAVFKGASLRDFADPGDEKCDLDDIMVNPEFRKLFEALQDSTVGVKLSAEGADISYECLKTHSRIESMINNRVWSSSSMHSWKMMREYVLRFPTIAADAKLRMVYDMYTKLPEPGNRVRYAQEDDYKFVHIGSNGESEVSMDDARLNEFLKIPCVRPLFGPPACVDSSKVPTEEDLSSIPYAEAFAENTAIMCPTLYHNIYKGALGEVAGTAILNDWGIGVSEIVDPNKFEKFDAITSSGVYLDFKHWYGPGGKDKDADFVKQAFRKLKTVDGTKAIVINILKPVDGSTKPSGYVLDGAGYSNGEEDYGGLQLITIPYLYDCNGETALINADAKRMITKAVRE